MKKQLLCLSSLCAVALSSCAILDRLGATLTSKECVTYDLYRADRSDPNTQIIKKAYKNRLHFRRDGDSVVPYVTLFEYVQMLSPLFDETVTMKISSSGYSSVWQVYVKDSYIFYAIHDPIRKEILIGGSLYGALTSNISDSSNSSISARVSLKRNVKNEGANYTTFSYASLETGHVYSGNSYFLPLAYLDASIGQTCQLYHFYDTRDLYVFSEYDQLTKESIYDSQRLLPYGNAARAFQTSTFGMPLSLRKLDRDTAYFVFETRYGLKKQKGISTMASYFEEAGAGKDMISDDDATRTKGFSKLFYGLDELHTTPSSLAPWWGDDVANFVFSPKYNDYLEKSKKYKEAQNFVQENPREDYRYYEASKTAFIEVSHFKATFAAYKQDGTLVDNIADLDSFFYLAKYLELAKQNGAKTVVLDLTTNPGGYVNVMGKMVTLLSKNNSATLSTYSESLEYDYDTIYTVDTNGDGVYDQEDVYGDDFNFYIMTSSISFSAGNAMPFYSRNHGFAKTIGINSGGGECSTESVFLPSGRSFNFSTDNHIVFRDGETFRHSEAGAGIDIPLSDDNFYDDQAVLNAIENAKNN